MPFKGQFLHYDGTPIHAATTTVITFTGKGVVNHLSVNVAGGTAPGNEHSQKMEILIDSVVVFGIELGNQVANPDLMPSKICNYLIGKTTAGTGMKAIVWSLAESVRSGTIDFDWKTFMPFTTSFSIRFVNTDPALDMIATVATEFIAEV
jgi:hypothetical protein